MRQLFLFISFLICSVASKADPGVGIVIDSKGNLFYTDLAQVWMIKPDGTKSIAVPNVHTHELHMNTKDELFGEHLWFNGEQLNTWGHYLWKRNPDGTVIKLKDSSAGLSEESFVRDIAGNTYFVEKDIPSKFWMMDTNGKKTLLGQASLSGIGRLHISPTGTLYFSNKGDLYCIPPGDTLQRYLANAGKPGLFDQMGMGTHTILHTWSDAKGNLYIATGNTIQQITKKKLITEIYRSTGDWYPCSGVIASNGDFWVLEANAKNEVRVNKISATERKQIVKDNSFSVYIMPLLIISGVLLILYFLFRRKQAKK